MTYLLLGLFVVAMVNYLIFIPIFGMEGAALATAFSALLFNISKYFLIWKFFKIQPFSWNTLKVAGVIVFTFFACSLIPEAFHPIANIIIRSTAVLTCFIGLVYTLNIVPELVEQVKAKLK